MKKSRLMKSAFSSLIKNKLRSFLMMIGIVIGITALTLIVSAALGARDRVAERVKKFGLDSMMVFAGASRDSGRSSTAQATTSLKPSDAEHILREVRWVADVAPFNRRSAVEIKYRDASASAALFGVTPSWAGVWDWDAAVGDFITDEDMASMNRVCLLGPTVKTALFGDENPVGKMIMVGQVQFRVKGILKAKGTSPGGGDMDNRVKIPLTTYLRRVANVDYLAGIKILLKSAADMDSAGQAIRAVLRERHGLAEGSPDDFTITTPTEVTVMAEKVAGTFNLFLILVAALSLIAGAVVIANITLISVNERKKEIGLRKAVGARSRDVRDQVILETLVLTVTGGLIGVLLGWIGVFIMQRFTELPASLSWEALVLGLVSAGITGLLSALHPAQKAAALPPVEALRS